MRATQILARGRDSMTGGVPWASRMVQRARPAAMGLTLAVALLVSARDARAETIKDSWSTIEIPAGFSPDAESSVAFRAQFAGMARALSRSGFGSPLRLGTDADASAVVRQRASGNVDAVVLGWVSARCPPLTEPGFLQGLEHELEHELEQGMGDKPKQDHAFTGLRLRTTTRGLQLAETIYSENQDPSAHLAFIPRREVLILVGLRLFDVTPAQGDERWTALVESLSTIASPPLSPEPRASAHPPRLGMFDRPLKFAALALLAWLALLALLGLLRPHFANVWMFLSARNASHEKDRPAVRPGATCVGCSAPRDSRSGTCPYCGSPDIEHRKSDAAVPAESLVNASHEPPSPPRSPRAARDFSIRDHRVVWLVSLLLSPLAGAVLYYWWRRDCPELAAYASRTAWWSAGVWLLVYMLAPGLPLGS